MATATVHLRNIPGTEAAAGWTGGHTIVVDRPEGKAGGMGLGFNGGQLLALAIGGCFCNDLRYVSHEMGVELMSIEIEVVLEMDGSPLIATSATMRVNAVATDPDVDLARVIEQAKAISTVANSLRRGFPVETTVA